MCVCTDNKPELGIEDGENYARVFGALETVMWPNMELKKKKKDNDTPQTNNNNNTSDVDDTAVAIFSENSDDLLDSSMSVKKVEQSDKRGLISDGGTGKETEINGKEPNTNGKETEINGKEPKTNMSGITSSPLAESASALSFSLGDDNGREKEMASMFASVLKAEEKGNVENEREENAQDGFDLNSWIEKIQGMRQSVGNLSDDERRNRASDLAMQLLSTLDIGEESD